MNTALKCFVKRADAICGENEDPVVVFESAEEYFVLGFTLDKRKKKKSTVYPNGG